MARHKTLRQREAALDALLGPQCCHIDLGGDAAEPDPLIGQAAKDNAELGKEYLELYKEQAAKLEPYQREAAEIALSQARQQVSSSQKQDTLADENAAYAKTFRPAEQALLSSALNYDTPERREQVAGQAMADVGTQADIARGNVTRMASARGVDVGSGNFTSQLVRTAVAEAAAKAAAGNTARLQTEQIGAAKLADAAAIGKGVVSNSAAQTQLALQAGNSGVANAGVPLAQANQQQQVAQGAYGTGIQANSSAGNLMLGSYNAQNNANKDDGMLGGIAQLASAGKYIFSDEDMKTDKKPVKGEVALSAARAMPVSKWKYKDGSPGDDGGKEHIGPMAQDANAALGEDAAPGGKMLDAAASGAVALAAVQELDRSVKRIEKKVIRLADARKPVNTQRRAA